MDEDEWKSILLHRLHLDDHSDILMIIFRFLPISFLCGICSLVNQAWKRYSRMICNSLDVFELSGHKGKHRALMGLYYKCGVTKGGFPTYKFAGQRRESGVYLYHSSGYWMIGSGEDVDRSIGWLSTAIPEDHGEPLPPFYLNNWEYWEGEWSIDSKLLVVGIQQDGSIIDFPQENWDMLITIERVDMKGHYGQHLGLMGTYNRDMDINGYPSFKFENQNNGKDVFMFHTENYWLVGSIDDIPRSLGWISSRYAGEGQKHRSSTQHRGGTREESSSLSKKWIVLQGGWIRDNKIRVAESKLCQEEQLQLLVL